MELAQLFGMDPAGWEAMVLCAAASIVLAALVFGGFLALRRAKAADKRRAPFGSEALGVLGLWRLNRALKRTDRG